ncbi:MAG: phosphodiesterase, partial [Ignavibacteriae bacterium]|nr:phosphodiesterase [Ignavibacteriota bacterium]
MLNQKSIDAVANSKFGDKFIKPLYDSYCFSNIPGTILSLFNINSDLKLPSDVLINHATKHKQVVVLLIDAFGWRF